MDLLTLPGTLLALVVASYLLDHWILSSRDPREPVYIRSRVPLVGHLWSLLTIGTSSCSRRVEIANPNLSAFTLPIFSVKIYVVADRRFYGALARSSKTLSFVPLEHHATRVLNNASDIVKRFADVQADDDDDRRAARRIFQAASSNFAPGPVFDRMSVEHAQDTLDFVQDVLVRCEKQPLELDLAKWVPHVATLALTNRFYGPLNPFKDPRHEASHWTVHDALPVILSGTSRLFARKAHRTMQDRWRTYEQYYQAGGIEQASEILKERTRVFTENGVSPLEAARLNTGFDIALISNYVPTVFWAVFDVLSRPQHLADIRREAEKAVSTSDDGSSHVLDLSVLRTRCPLLLSSVQETQRLRSDSSMIRQVLDDTIISAGEEQYLLKKGNYVHFHHSPVLLDTRVWGEDASEFNPRRFMRMNTDDKRAGGVVGPGQLPPMAFTVWGVPPHMCPARFYATSVIMAMIAVMALRLDVAPAEGSGDATEGVGWREPRGDANFTVVHRPCEPVPVVVRPRAQWQGEWAVRVGTPGARLQSSVA